MALTPGTRLGPYEVVSLLGEGGMGQVYRATDTRLKRDVAIKVLLPEVAQSPERLARFEREAQILASLNHPNIAAIYGVEQAGDATALVLEFIDGPTLADRISRGPIPLDEALPIARQIAEALEAAHEQGIIHRDLKPANIKVRPDGTVKVLDFGLAKALEPVASSSPPLSMSPTLTSPAMTQAGMILGTAAYMSPEQARGRTVDKRSDIWAFGCVLFEMLTGTRAFGGEDIADTLGNVMKIEPSWNRMPASVPHHVVQVMRACLQKNPRQRMDSAQDVRLALDGAFETAPSTVVTSAKRSRIPVAIAAVVGIIAAGLVVPAVRHLREMAAPPTTKMLFELAVPPSPSAAVIDFAMDPDGSRVVVVGITDGRRQSWIRQMAATASQPLAGTDGAQRPFWSPDGQSIGFFAAGRLRRIDSGGGRATELASARQTRGGSWSGNTIIFSPNPGSPIYTLPADGGEPVPVTQLDPPRQTGHSGPQFLPDGRHFLYFALGSPGANGVYVGNLDGSPGQRLFESEASAKYSNGFIYFTRSDTLFAQRFDPVRLTLSGSPESVAEGVRNNAQDSAFSLARSGAIAYRAAQPGAGGTWQFRWFDRSGHDLGTVGAPDLVFSDSPSLSPDGQHVALLRVSNGNGDIWTMDLDQGVLSRFTLESSNENMPLWSPDGQSIVFSSDRRGAGVHDIYRKSAPGLAGGEDVLLTSPTRKIPTDWSRDGRFLIFDSIALKDGSNIMALPLARPPEPATVVATAFDERNGQLSPDGKWLAYESNKSGRYEVYVQPFPGQGGDVQVSNSGGAQVRWSPDGRELFYVALDDVLMSVAVSVTANPDTLRTGTLTPLFRTRIGGAVQSNSRQQYMVAPDGKRFLMYTVADELVTTPVKLLLNWRPSAN